MDGICTLANDRVYDQLVALLNSIEVIAGETMPVCVYPYDDNLERISAEISRRPNVQLYDNQDSIATWDRFAYRVWDTHPTARERWQKVGSNGYHRFGTHRRYCAFDEPFERFLYMDADTLLMSSVDFVFEKLNDYDCVVYDFQYKDLTHVYEISSPKLLDVFERVSVEKDIFCSGFYGSKKGLFPEEKREWLITQLEAGDAEILYPMAPDQTIINYMMMKSGASLYNFALELPKEQRTGCCVTSPHFQAKNNILYDQENPLTYIHYIGMSSSVFTQLCAGENIDFPYRDIFLYYRYLKEPENYPKFKTQPKWYQKSPSLGERILKKLRKG